MMDFAAKKAPILNRDKFSGTEALYLQIIDVQVIN
jgi:hypothetical protein